MRIVRSTIVDSPAVTATTPIRLLFLVDNDESSDNKNHLPLRQSSDIDVPETGVDANFVELKIFSVIFSVFLLVIFYFAVKAVVRTWKRRNADYLVTWAHNHHNKNNTCKCVMRQKPVTPKTEPAVQLTTTGVVKIVQADEDEADAETGPPTTSSGVGTVESSDASAETSSTNPLMELLSTAPAPCPDQAGSSETAIVEIALISPSRVTESSASSDAPILRHHHHAKRKVAAVGLRRKRSSNSSPPSPVFPRRRPETDDSSPGGSTVNHNHRHRRTDPFGQQRHRHPRRKAKRRVSLDAAEECGRFPVGYFYGKTLPTDIPIPIPTPTPAPAPASVSLANAPLAIREWHQTSRMWVDNDDEDAGSLSIPLSVATAPPDYFDTMNAEWEKQGFCPLYKSHRT